MLRFDSRATRRAYSLITIAGFVIATPLLAQNKTPGEEPSGGTRWACYVPNSGTVYRVRTVDTKETCASHVHVLFQWGTGTGSEGPMGPAGPIGPAGAVGPIGPQGETGPAGAAGPTGATGADGAAGAAGAPGAAGADGVTGAAGANGAIGAVGPQGPAGAGGAQGPVGPTGPIGPQGDKGPQGDRGPQGEAGPAGANGTNGAAGAAGAQGPPGPAGAQGPIGPAGPQGPAGPAGPQGLSGPISRYEMLRTSFTGNAPNQNAQVMCTAPRRALGGGFEFSGPQPNPTVVASVPINPAPGTYGWTVKAGRPNDGATWTITAWVVCADAM